MVFTVAAFKDQLVAALKARSGLAGVTIYDAETNLDDTTREAIIVGDWRSGETDLTMTPSTLETYSVDVKVVIRKPSAKQARDRAVAILTELKTLLLDDWTQAGLVLDAKIASVTGQEDLAPDGGRQCRIEAEIEVAAETAG